MTIQIDHGLFTLGMVDHHAILGLPVDIEAKKVRKPYLKIVRRLHPDSLQGESEVAKQRASELLSKLVNPAYELLFNEKEMAEYQLLLKLKGQQLQREAETLQLTSEAARQLTSAGNVGHAYHKALQELSSQQYDSLETVIDITGQISELNLVYLMRTAGAKIEAKPKAAPANASNQPNTAPSPTTANSQAYKPEASAEPRKSRTEVMVENHLRRASELTQRKDYPRAVQELREALKLDSGNAECHSRLGYIYIKSNQPTMAKIHFNKALELEPNLESAVQGKQQLGKILAANQRNSKAAGTTGKSSKSTKSGKSDQGKSGGGLFGLFGGKKK